MPSWKKVITSGSDASLNSLNVTSGVTGSLLGTASYATQALSASYALTASYAPGGGNPFPFNGNAQISGSFGVTGSFVAITVNDAAFTRKLHDSQTGSGSLDFGNRNLLDGTGNGVFNWNGIAATIDASLYLNQTIGATTRDSLITNIGYSGFSLNNVTFNSAVSPNDLVYLETDSKWYQTNQTTDTSTKLLGICISSNPFFGHQGTVFTEGDLVVTTGMGLPYVQNANYGLPIYIMAGGGTQMSTTIPTSGYVRVLGYVYHNSGTEWIMKFRPSNDWYVI